jgi:hypothetical protein
MDWSAFFMMLLPVASGLGGAWIMGRFHLRAQELTQREGNARHARKVAYDAAVKEWERMREYVFRELDRIDKINAAGGSIKIKPIPLPPLEDYIIHHLAFSEEAVGRIKPDSGFSEIEQYVIRSRQRARVLLTLREKLAEEDCEDAEKANDNASQSKKN